MSLITPSEPVEAVPENASPAPPRDRSRRWLVAALVTAIAVIAALVAVVAWPDDGDDTATTEPTTTVTMEAPTTAPSTTAAPTTTAPPTTAPTTAPPAVDTTTAVFPSGAGAPRYDDPVAAARAFAVDLVGFTDPVVGPYRAGDIRSGEVAVRAKSTGPATTVMVRRLGADGSWWVIGAATDNVTVTSPAAGDAIASPVSVTGSALAWEGNVNGEIRQDGTRAPLGTGVFTGGGDVMRPFSGSISYSAPSQPYGALVLVTHSAEDGRVWQATVLRVAFDR
jgi:Immunoglobulin-like domain of bacterial spore germination